MENRVFCVTLVLLLLASLFAGCKSSAPDGGNNSNSGAAYNRNNNDSAAAENGDGSNGSADTPKAGNGMELAAPPLGENGAAGTGTSTAVPGAGQVQDVYPYADGKLGTEDMSEDPGYYVRTLRGDNAYEIFAGYIEYLKQNGFTVADNSEKIYTEVSFYAVTLTDTRSVIEHTIPQQFDKTLAPGNIFCYCKIEGKRLTGQVCYAPEYDVRDFGARFGGENADISYAGVSSGAGLYSDGVHFETTDGRLKTELGKATVIYGGNTYTAAAEATRKDDIEALDFFVENYYRSESAAFRYRENYLMEGDLLTDNELKVSNVTQGALNKTIRKITDLHGRSYPTLLLFNHNDRLCTVSEDGKGGITKSFVRAMIYEKGKLAVLYIAAEFDLEPKTIEILCAFDLTNAASVQNSGGGGDGTLCIVCGGDGKVTCGECNGTGTIERYAAGGGTITSGCPTCRGQKKWNAYSAAAREECIEAI